MLIDQRLIQVDADGKRYGIYDTVTDLADTYWADVDSPNLIGDIYREMMKEYGRCTGKVYVDTVSRHLGFGVMSKAEVKHVGWVFEKRVKYTDCDDTYLQETWITLLDKDDTIHVRKHHYIGR